LGALTISCDQGAPKEVLEREKSAGHSIVVWTAADRTINFKHRQDNGFDVNYRCIGPSGGDEYLIAAKIVANLPEEKGISQMRWYKDANAIRSRKTGKIRCRIGDSRDQNKISGSGLIQIYIIEGQPQKSAEFGNLELQEKIVSNVLSLKMRVSD
ncbi:MAG: hypothetical protein L0287_31345, partial [Anaerolineae bacterium]|nr:hypothetical protein [Anaerolineae bacterium]